MSVSGLKALVLGAVAAGASIAVSASAVTVANASFEAPVLGSGFAYNPVVAGNVFNASSGIQGNGSAWGFVAAPDGVQTAFLQSYSTSFGSVAMDVTGLQNGASYTLTFSIADRPGYGDNPLTVRFNAINLGTYAATSTLWATHTTGTFVATGTTATLLFEASGNTGYDAGIGLDAVSIAGVPGAVPEPASWALMIGGFGLVGSALRRRRSVALTA
ncbi:MAG TPA: PEPxxWA-CTERM sorting domain-containing protein [Polymorphobacter sp.]|jgi:hypothetical protein|nr:PEPxxWA-CTERM sorting domain-containing protein [Polymorphobacter sp.]